jgi:uncharacterized protein YbaR (Trm112 family)
MFIELVDALRCPTPHEESWLVVAADRLHARHIVDGVLGCPVCHASYPIWHGVVDFCGAAPQFASATVSTSSEPTSSAPSAVTADAGERLAAQLDLRDALGFAVLLGDWGAYAAALLEHGACPLVLVDPPTWVEARPGLSILRTAGPIPIAAGAARAVAIDAEGRRGESDRHAQRVESAVRAVRTKGRVVGAASLPLPPGVREIARDSEVWVAEREPAASPLVSLHVRRGVVGELRAPTPPRPAGT